MWEILIQYIIIFLIVFLTYYVFVLRKIGKKTKDKPKKRQSVFMMFASESKEYMELTYLKNLYKLDLRKINTKKTMLAVALINSTIIALTSCVIVYVDNFFVRLLIAAFIVFGLIVILYHLLGTYLKRREKKDE